MLVATVAILAVCAALIAIGRAVFIPGPPAMSGTVISQSGEPVVGATVVVGDRTVVTADDGGFRITSDLENAWVRVSHPDFEPRVRAARRGEPVLVRLTADPLDTVTMHFTGDVMFGRRFYDPNEDGDTADALLRADAGVADHFALLRPVEPLLAAADLTIVNLETPLINEPTFAFDEARPERFHPTKEFAFASEPTAAAALQAAGVDVVDLGNNHLYDALEAGVASTIEALDAAGVLHYGAGANEEEAWTPAVIGVEGTSVAFIGCTSISGDEHALAYVAGPDKGGAARCDEQEIRVRVASAAAAYDTVVFSIHGGYEYGRDPSAGVRRLSVAAREAGARLVVNHHPHVTGGFDLTDGTLTAWTMGNFVFDQTVWPTFGSYLVAAAVRDNELVRAYVEPLMIEEYSPRGLTGDRAIHMSREAAGRAPGPFLLEDGAMEVDLAGAAIANQRLVAVSGDPTIGSVYRVNGGASVAAVAPGGDGRVVLGRDLLSFGSFENEAVDPARTNGSFWDLLGTDRRTSAAAAYSGEAGAELRRDRQRQFDAVLSPIHRVLVTPGSQLSIIGRVKTVGEATVSLQMSWYPDTKGPSIARTMQLLVDDADADWRAFRLDVTVPDGIVAAGLFIRLAPPPNGVARARIDDLAMVEWAGADTEPGPLFDYVKVAGDAELVLSHDVLAGGEPWATIDDLSPTGDDVVATAVVDLPEAPPTTVPLTTVPLAPLDPEGVTEDGIEVTDDG